ncbi:unnamed protein product [Discosporangium mesarthrocarpum]
MSLRRQRPPRDRLTASLAGLWEEQRRGRTDFLLEGDGPDSASLEPLSDLLWDGPEELPLDPTGRIQPTWTKASASVAASPPPWPTPAQVHGLGRPGVTGGTISPTAGSGRQRRNPFAPPSMSEGGGRSNPFASGSPTSTGRGSGGSRDGGGTGVRTGAGSASRADSLPPELSHGFRSMGSLNPFTAGLIGMEGEGTDPAPRSRSNTMSSVSSSGGVAGGSGNEGLRGGGMGSMFDVPHQHRLPASEWVPGSSEQLLGSTLGHATPTSVEEGGCEGEKEEGEGEGEGMKEETGGKTRAQVGVEDGVGLDSFTGAVEGRGAGAMGRLKEVDFNSGAVAEDGCSVGEGHCPCPPPLPTKVQAFSYDGSIFHDPARLCEPHLSRRTYRFDHQRVELAIRGPGGLRLEPLPPLAEGEMWEGGGGGSGGGEGGLSSGDDLDGSGGEKGCPAVVAEVLDKRVLGGFSAPGTNDLFPLVGSVVVSVSGEPFAVDTAEVKEEKVRNFARTVLRVE